MNYNIDEISNFFPEFLNVKSKCKFNNCIHLNEPKCYVKEKVNLEKFQNLGMIAIFK